MLNSAVVDVAIGLALIFLLVSLLVTAACEAAAGWRKWRSTHLWEGVEQLLQSSDARTLLYNHPLVKGLARVGVGPVDWGPKGQAGPSYIPARTFALAVVDILRRPHRTAAALEDGLRRAIEASADPATLVGAVDAVLRHAETDDATPRVQWAVRQLRARAMPEVDAAAVQPLRADLAALVATLSPADRAIAGPIDAWLQKDAAAAASFVELRTSLQAAIDAIAPGSAGSPNERLRQALAARLDAFPHGRPEALLTEIRAFLADAPRRWLEAARQELPATVDALAPMLHKAGGDADRFREQIETWFDDGMERVSGWYKRHIAVRQAIIAFLLAAGLNIDAIQITQTLWREPTLRQSLAASATDGAQRDADPAAPGGAYGRPAAVPQPVPGPTPPPAADPAADASTPANAAPTAALQVPRLFAGGSARLTVSLPKPASDTTRILVTTADSLLWLGVTASDAQEREVTIAPGAGQTSAELFVAAGALTVERVAQVKITVSGDTDASGNNGSTTVDVPLSPADSFSLFQKRLRGLGLPIGWECPPDAAAGGSESGVTIGGPVWCSTPTGRSGRRWTSLSWLGIDSVGERQVRGRVVAQRAYMLVLMVFGWSLTAAAASLGAPFWFDTLKRVASIRAGGKPPQEHAAKAS